MGEQLSPTRTSSPERSRPSPAATADAAELLEGTTLAQQRSVSGGFTGGTVVRRAGVAAARVCGLN
jgi:hypothetical protein